MIKARKRGNTYHADYMIGRVHVVRGTLDTQHGDAARNYCHRLEIALSQGPSSPIWAELSPVIPPRTFLRFARYAGVKQKPLATLSELFEKYEADMEQRVKIGDLAPNSVNNYRRVLREFERFVATREIPIQLVREIEKPVAKQFKYWRIENIQKKKGMNGGAGYSVDAALMHRVFEFAIEHSMISENPFEFEPKVRDPRGGAQPFTGEELLRFREHATEEDLLCFLVFRRTGLRASDVATLAWGEVDLEAKEIRKPTQKSGRRKTAVLRIHDELLSVMRVEHKKRNPSPSDTVLLNPKRCHPVTKGIITYQIQRLGKRAGVEGTHPQRFRDTFAVDALLRFVPELSVARMLADTLEAVTNHYLPYVKELREHAQDLLNNGKGLEEYAEARRRHNGQHADGVNEEEPTQSPTDLTVCEESELMPVSE